MRPVSRLLFRFLCLIAALSMSGAQYGIGQAVAWADMLMKNADKEQMALAVEHTFDGEHPCCRCLKVQEESNKEHQDPQQKALKEFKPITGGICEFQRLIFLPTRTLLTTLQEEPSTLRAGFYDEAFQPPECA